MKILFIQSEAENISIELLSSYLKANNHEVYLFFDPKLFSSSVISVNLLGRIFDLKNLLLDRIKEIKPDIIGFSVMTDNYQWALRTAAEIKSNFNIPIIFGGHHVISVPGRVIENACIDIVCIGEGEESLLELLNSMQKGSVDYGIKNLWYKVEGAVIKNDLRDLESNLDKYPAPDKDLFYQEMPLLKKHYTTMFSRGCCYSCTYCCNNVRMAAYKGKGKYLRIKSVQQAIGELIEAEKKYNPKVYCFADDMITAYKQWFKEFAIEYKKHINKPYVCYTHPKFFNEEIGALMKESNCMWLNFGLQTASERLRREVLGRIETNDEVRKCAEICNRLKLKFSIDHIFDIPLETEADYIESAKLYNELQPTIINTFYLAYYPSTAIIQTAVKNGILKADDIEKIEEGKFTTTFTISIGSDERTKKRIEMYNRYLLAFTLIPILPKFILDTIIDKGYYKHFAKIPTFFIMIIKIFLRIKIGQFYLYWGEIERLSYNVFKVLKLKWSMKKKMT